MSAPIMKVVFTKKVLIYISCRKIFFQILKLKNTTLITAVHKDAQI